MINSSKRSLIGYNTSFVLQNVHLMFANVNLIPRANSSIIKQMQSNRYTFQIEWNIFNKYWTQAGVIMAGIEWLNNRQPYQPQIKCCDSAILTRQFDCRPIRAKLLLNYIFCLLSAKLPVDSICDVCTDDCLFLLR